ncbi:MAG: DNA polymerase IV [Saprospiraceae bacterium]|nr:DNA polymerase IV [Saprospiraceae bacterium]MCB9322910.1 DNA polymerase IV [Lewinellaceae bacterium]
MTDRKIIHIDMDAFFASVEQRDNPSLKGKPVVVGGSGSRGVIAAASYEARVFGVRSAMASAKAVRLCPNLIFVKHRFDVYREVSAQVREIFHEYTDLVEPLSIDEAYLDVTENKKGIGSAIKIAMEIREKIRLTTQLTASAGVSFNKFLAKIASDINKPDGLKVILPEEAEAFLDQLPIHKFHGIGKVTAERMKNMGVFNGADLKKCSEIDLVHRFGKAGRHYYKIVRAQDNRPVNPNRIRKSIGAERTYSEDISSTAEKKEKLKKLAGIVFDYMKKTDNFGRTISIKVRNEDFKTITRSRSFNSEVRDLEQIEAVGIELLESCLEGFEKVRLLGLTVSNLEKEHVGEGIQLSFEFED